MKLDLTLLPITKKKIRDDCSTAIFLYYASLIDPKIAKRFKKFISSDLEESPLAYPISTDAMNFLIHPKKSGVKSTFLPEHSASLSHGICASIMRLFQAGLTEKRRKLVGSALHQLEKISHKRGERIFWINFFREGPDSPLRGAISLSTHRGMGGAISCLSLCYEMGIEQTLCLRLLKGAMAQIKHIEKASGERGLPGHWAISNIAEVSPSLYYGDPGIGHVILLAGIRCRQKSWIKFGKKIFERGVRRSLRQVEDPTFATGAAGYSHLCYRYFLLFGNKEFLKLSKKWMKHAERLYDEKLKDFELSVDRVKVRRERRKLGKNPNSTPACLHNSSLGIFLVKWFQEGLIDGDWDFIYGLSTPSIFRL